MLEQTQTLFEALIPFIQFGFIAGISIAVIIAAGKIGFRLAPYILLGAALVYFFG
jgi:hypothetical protein